MTIRGRFRDRCKAKKGQLPTFFSFRSIWNCLTVMNNTEAYHWKLRGGSPEAISTIIGTTPQKKKEASLQICVHSSSDLPPPHELEVRTPICQRWRCSCWHNTRSAATSGAVLLSKLGSLTLLTVCPSWTNKQHCKNPKFCCKEGAFGFYWSSVARKRHFEMKSDITKSLYPCLLLSPLCRAAWSNTWTDDKEVWKEEKLLRLEGLEYYTE